MKNLILLAFLVIATNTHAQLKVSEFDGVISTVVINQDSCRFIAISDVEVIPPETKYNRTSEELWVQQYIPKGLPKIWVRVEYLPESGVGKLFTKNPGKVFRGASDISCLTFFYNRGKIVFPNLYFWYDKEELESANGPSRIEPILLDGYKPIDLPEGWFDGIFENLTEYPWDLLGFNASPYPEAASEVESNRYGHLRQTYHLYRTKKNGRRKVYERVAYYDSESQTGLFGSARFIINQGVIRHFSYNSLEGGVYLFTNHYEYDDIVIVDEK